MEHQHKYQAAKWQPWKCKQLQPLSTVFENAILEAWTLIAKDSEHAEITENEMADKINSNDEVIRFTEMGYFMSQIIGPKNYMAIGLFKTPYSAALIVLEQDFDVLEKEEGGQA
jgi:hypothetical protein